MTRCGRSPTIYMGCHLASADILLVELSSSRSRPCRRERCRVPADLQIADRASG